MLILSRRLGEEIVVGDNVRIVVTRLRNGQVGIGIEAPRDVRILRGELEDESEATDELVA